jgi:hypothetical protein
MSFDIHVALEAIRPQRSVPATAPIFRTERFITVEHFY